VPDRWVECEGHGNFAETIGILEERWDWHLEDGKVIRSDLVVGVENNATLIRTYSVIYIWNAIPTYHQGLAFAEPI